MPTFDDPPTREDEAARREAEASDAHYQAEQDVLEALQERDEAIAELAEAAAELDRMRELAHVRLVRLLEIDPAHQPSAPRDRQRFAGEDETDYALRGE